MNCQAVIQGRGFFLDSAQREAQEEARGLSTDELMRTLVSEVQLRALVPVSDFRVGAAGINDAGEVFLGVNIEFAGASFAQTVHAEQFLVSLSRTYSTSKLVRLAVSAPPCGHCRQFLTEFDPDGELEMLIGDEPAVKMHQLLPRAFGPSDLHVTEPFYCQSVLPSDLGDIEEAACRAAVQSYVPYSKTRAGTAVRSKDGRVFIGSAIENAAYNPGLPPLQAAVVSAYAAGVKPEDICEVVLCQAKGGQIDYEPQMRDLAVSLSSEPVDFRAVFI